MNIRQIDIYVVDKSSMMTHISLSLHAQAFPPMTPYANAFTQKAASLFGLKSSQQGSGRKRFVIVAATQRTHALDAADQERLAQLVSSQEGAVRALNPRTKPSTSGKHPILGAGNARNVYSRALLNTEKIMLSLCYVF